MKYSHRYLFLLLLTVAPLFAVAQNIVGWKIVIGADAPAFLAFPSEVDNARWDNNEMSEYFKFSTRNENTMQISYNGKKDPPATGTGFSVIQGKNTHIFTLVFKKDYDINKDPVLYYDFSDKSKLKAAADKVRSQGSVPAGNTKEEPPAAAADTRAQEQADKAEKEKQHKEAEQQQKELASAQQKKKKEIETQQKADAEKGKQEEKIREAEIARAKLDAQRIAAEQQKAKEQEQALAKADAAAAEKKKAETLRLKKEQEAEEQQQALEAAQSREKEKQEKDKAKAEQLRIAREEAERKNMAARAAQEKLAKEKQEQEAAEKERKAALALQQAEDRRKAKEEADAKLLALQQARETAKKNAQYSVAGLWSRYGKKGINLYEIPPEQFNFNNTDFYVAKDTQQNFEQSNIFLAEPPRLDIAADPQQEITASLKSISFKGPIAYYRIEIKNNSKEDYLVGANNLAWYNPDNSPKVFLKCSYLSYIGFFPLVKPGATLDYIYATRAANINADDQLVLTVKERRAERPGFSIAFDGSVYKKELARVEKPIEAASSGKTKDTEPKESKKERKARERKEKEQKGEK